MTIIAVFPPYVYSIRYGDGEEKDEYHRLLGLWTDVDYLSDYFETNCSRMNPEVWGDGLEPEIVADHALNEAYESMQEDPDLNKELDKIKTVRSFLRNQGIETREDL